MSFQKVDKWKGEVLNNFTWRVVQLESDDFTLDNDNQYRHPISVVLRNMIRPAAYGYTARPAARSGGGGMKPGERRLVS